MKSVSYTTYNKLGCTCGAEVIICVDDSLTASGFPFIEGVVAFVDSVINACGRTSYRYAFTYQDGVLADPDYSLVEADIAGAFCKNCLTDWVESLIVPGVDCTATPVEAGIPIVCADGVAVPLACGNLGDVLTITSTDPCEASWAAGGGGDFWALLGNAGTVDGTNFIGTTDNVAHDVRVNNVRVRRSEPDTYCPRIVDGRFTNTAEGYGSAILSGGGDGVTLLGRGMLSEIWYTNVIDQANAQALPIDTAWSVIAGGAGNKIINRSTGSDLGGASACFIGSGKDNVIGDETSLQNWNFTAVIVGGESNTIDVGYGSFIGSGYNNVITGYFDADYAYYGSDNCFIGSGQNNFANGASKGFIGSGNGNSLDGAFFSFIGTGYANNISLDSPEDNGNLNGNAIVAGDYNNIENSDWNFIGSGEFNEIVVDIALWPGYPDTLIFNCILGGYANYLKDASCSSILGGHALKLGSLSCGYQGKPLEQNLAIHQTDLSAFSQIFYVGDVDLWIGNRDNSARKLKFFEPNTSLTYTGTNYTSMRAQAQAANIDYIFPAAAGALSNVLQVSNVSGTDITLAWTAPLAGATAFTWSTTEQVWPWEKNDAGETLYAKQVDIGNLPNATTKNVAHGITVTSSKIFKIYGIMYDTNAPEYNILPIPFVIDDTGEVCLYMGLTNVIVITKANYSSWIGKVRIIYAK